MARKERTVDELRALLEEPVDCAAQLRAQAETERALGNERLATACDEGAERQDEKAAALRAAISALEIVALGEGAEALPLDDDRGDYDGETLTFVDVRLIAEGATPTDARRALAGRLIKTVRRLLEKP